MIMDALITLMVKIVAPLAGGAFAALLAVGSRLEILLPLPGLAVLAYLVILLGRREKERSRVEGHH